MINILIVEDDNQLNKILCDTINGAGYCSYYAYNGEQAIKIMEEKKIDLILSDIMMPIMDGYEFAKTVRLINPQIPFIFMTAKDDFASKQRGFEIGIDDYIVKPFDINELLLRIKSVLRRANISTSKKLQIGEFFMNEEEHIAKYKGKEIPLTVKEFELLFKLLSNPQKTYTRSSLMDEFWDYDSSATSRTIDVHMAKLREKTSVVQEFSIVTVHGLGYKVVINEKK